MRKQIESLQEKLDALLGRSLTGTAKKNLGRPAGKKRTMSVAGRNAIAAAQKARWAKINGKSALKTVSKKPARVKAAPQKKGGISAEGRAKLAAAMKARWAAKKKVVPDKAQ